MSEWSPCLFHVLKGATERGQPGGRWGVLFDAFPVWSDEVMENRVERDPTAPDTPDTPTSLTVRDTFPNIDLE